MELVLYIVPFLTSIILFVFFRKQAKWWEYALVIAPSLLFALITKTIVTSVRTSDIEYWGAYITKVRHYDPWDEWIHQTCTREVAVGVDSEGNTIYEEETYDCSYREYHSEYWTYFSSLNRESTLTKSEFEKIRTRFGTPGVFVDMHRHYYTLDGDAQDYYWNGTRNTIRTLTVEHHYRNKVKCSKSIFRLDDISKKEAKRLELLDYPPITNLDQEPVISAPRAVKATQQETDAIKYINAIYGAKNQIRVYVLLFDARTEDIETAFKQQSYWDGGNKNELVVCLGVTPDREISWCHAFSWEDAPLMAVGSRDFFTEQEKLDIVAYGDWLIENISSWRRKEFKDFEYLKVDMTRSGYIVLFILLLIYNIGISIFVIVNEYQNEDFD